MDRLILAEGQQGSAPISPVSNAINSARWRWRPPPVTVFRTDRGSRYAAEEVVPLTAALGRRQSFSGVGRPGGSAWHESFCSNLKKEPVNFCPQKRWRPRKLTVHKANYKELRALEEREVRKEKERGRE